MKFICVRCEHMYNPERGDLEAGVPPETPFEQLPESWRCPECHAAASDFAPDETEGVAAT